MEVTNGTADAAHYGPVGDAARRVASYCDGAARAHVYAAAFTALAAKEAELAEMTRRRDEWRKKAEGFDAIRHALREKVGSPWPPSLSRALWAALAADEKKRADDAEAENAELRAKVEKLRAMLLNLIGAVDELIANSGGVYGLHLNGDPAPWDELTEGGRGEDWLVALEDARTTALAAKEDQINELQGHLHLANYQLAAEREKVEKLRVELRIGDKVRVIGKYEADWQGYDLWITGINVDHEGLNYTVGEQWPVPHRHMGGYIGMTDGFREGDLARTTLAETQP